MLSLLFISSLSLSLLASRCSLIFSFSPSSLLMIYITPPPFFFFLLLSSSSLSYLSRSLRRSLFFYLAVSRSFPCSLALYLSRSFSRITVFSFSLYYRFLSPRFFFVLSSLRCERSLALSPSLALLLSCRLSPERVVFPLLSRPLSLSFFLSHHGVLFLSLAFSLPAS